MAIARNMVIAGDFVGEKVVIDKSCKGYEHLIIIDKKGDLITSIYKSPKIIYHLVHEDISKSPGDVLMGALAFGAVGALIGSSVTQKTYTIAIEKHFRDRDFEIKDRRAYKNINYKYLIEIDDELYKVFFTSMF